MMNRSFGVTVQFDAPRLTRSANANTAPIPPSGAVTSDLGLALLHRITGV